MGERKLLSLSKVILGGLVAAGASTTLPAVADEVVDEGSSRNLVVFDDEGRMLVEGAVPSALFDDVIVRSVLITEEGDAVGLNIFFCSPNTNCPCPKPTEPKPAE